VLNATRATSGGARCHFADHFRASFAASQECRAASRLGALAMIDALEGPAFSVARASYFTRYLQFALEAVLMRNASYFFLASPIGHIAWLRPTE
jgi:hypothetical protein